MADILRFLGWYLAIFVIGWVSFPIIYRFLPHLASKGFALARPLGLLIWGFLFWLLGSLGVLQNDLGGVIVAFIMLLGISIWCCSRERWREMLNWLKENMKMIRTMEILFFIMFAAWTIVRAANPDAAYTEKPMELAFINSLLKSPTFPPQDPWLSGYAISYYYFGYVIISMIIRVTGVASSIAFNLSSSLWFALTALAAFGIVFDLLASRKRNPAEQDQKHLDLARRGGFLGPLFILVISCLEGVLEFLYAWGVFWKPDSQGNLVSKFWSWLAISELDTAPTGVFSWFPSRPSGWLWWRGSRVIQDLSLTNGKIEVIDEFPFFSYLLSDLHPHVLAMPFGLLAVGICLNLFLNPKSFYTIGGSIFKWFKRWDFWLIAVVLGSFAFINTWDFPIYVGLYCLVIVFIRIKEHGWGWIRFWELIKYGLIIGITSVVLYLPFYLGFKSQAGGILPSMEYMTRGIHFWILFGALLVPIVIWLIYQLRQTEKPWKIGNGLKFSFILFSILLLVSLLFGILILNAGQISSHLLESPIKVLVSLGQKLETASQAFAGLHGSSDAGYIVSQSLLRRLVSPGTWITLFLMLTVVWALLFGSKKPTARVPEIMPIAENSPSYQVSNTRNFVCILILVGIALTVFPEFFYLRDQFGSRMNTIFKFYFEAWILWGLAAAYASAELFALLKGIRSWIFNIVWVVVILCGLAYPVIMLWQKTDGFHINDITLKDKSLAFDWTLDGNAYIARGDQDKYLAIQWLSTVPPDIIVEAVGDSYSPDYNQISARTGLPTVLGWPGHEGQWRDGYREAEPRKADVKLLYETSNWEEANNIILKYNIRYIYIGADEQKRYQVDMTKFAEHLPIVYQNETVRIFEVSESKGDLIQ